MAALLARALDLPAVDDPSSLTDTGDNLYAAIDDGSLAARAQALLDAGGVQMLIGG
jgi:hypothetical protein